MKQKTTDDQTLTKQDLLDAFKDFRKEFLKERMFDIEFKLDHLKLQIEDNAKKRHSEVLTRFDEWAGELETAREDRIITTKQLKDHEKRIKKLEKIQN